ncbi:hypothetical protein [Paraburkholderia sp.]|uniref:hypothetical protein n=1 Tax=Paraburkholderia sp. TaxID=1926495 RepID=UPI0025F53C0B|nr:hypothetical protein [Paraburkholderia sp.]
MKPISLLVQMPAIGVFSIGRRSGIGEIEQPTQTLVHGLRRHEFKGVLSESCVWAKAFVKEEFRQHLRATGKLIDGEYVWCLALLKDNRKSLAAFFASSDREWTANE